MSKKTAEELLDIEAVRDEFYLFFDDDTPEGAGEEDVLSGEDMDVSGWLKEMILDQYSDKIAKAEDKFGPDFDPMWHLRCDGTVITGHVYGRAPSAPQGTYKIASGVDQTERELEVEWMPADVVQELIDERIIGADDEYAYVPVEVQWVVYAVDPEDD